MSESVILNPITSRINESIDNASSEILIAVPFISSFAKKVFTQENSRNVKSKRLVTRFDDENLNSFELSTLKYLLDLGFEIQYLNDIHLKIYLFDSNGFATSSNLTKGGFEKNIELTNILDANGLRESKSIFEKLWEQSADNKINLEQINSNYPKYELLKKRTRYSKKSKDVIPPAEVNTTQLTEIKSIVEQLFAAKEDYSDVLSKAFNANEERNKMIELISTNYKKEHFYVAKSHPDRKSTLHYQIVHGAERKISGSGLREGHFESVSKSEQLDSLIAFLFPPSVKQKNWNLDNEEEFREYCNGIFEFEIPQYSTTMPIRLASYFNPNNFIPIFVLNELKEICEILGFKSNSASKGDRLFEYNWFLLKRMKSIPYGNYVKMNIAYQLYFIFQLKKGYQNGLSFEEIGELHKKKWKQKFLLKGSEILTKNSSA